MEEKYYKRVILIGRRGKVTPEQKDIYDTLVALKKTLELNNFQVEVELETYKTFKELGQGLDCHTMGRALNLVADSHTVGVVVGGDGTMLDAARISKFPLIGVNFGQVGFITDIPRVRAVDTVLEMLTENFFSKEERTLLEVFQWMGDSRNEYVEAPLGVGLNDFVIIRRSTAMIEFAVSINSDQAYEFKADGMIVTTPTGSTAYGLAAGGSIIHPSSKVLALIPMFPQTLSCRPIVVDEKSGINIHVSTKVFPEITLDGQPVEIIRPKGIRPKGSSLEFDFNLTAALQKAIFLHPSKTSKYSYFGALSQKLGWNHRPNA